MAEINFNPSFAAILKDKVVVLTGGAAGIGRAAVKYFHSAVIPFKTLYSEQRLTNHRTWREDCLWRRGR